MRASRTLVIVLCGALLWASPAGAGAGLHLAPGLTSVEETVLRALDAAGLDQHVVRLAADTNGHLTVATVTFTYPAADHDFLSALNVTAWRIIRTVFAAVPSLDELDVVAYHQARGWFNGLRRDPTMTAAVTKAELARVPTGTPESVALALLPRIWYHPLVLRSGLRDGAAGEYLRHLLSAALLTEQTVTFVGSMREQAAERHIAAVGRSRGGVIGGKLYRGNPTRPVFALTFDDGPSPIYTTLLLDSLRRANVRATFFLVGLRVVQFPYFATAILAEGHELGNHSFHHVNLTRLSGMQVERELALTQNVIGGITGMTPRYFRPPGGQYNATVLTAAERLGLVTVFWTDDPGDYGYPLAAVEHKLFALAANGGIVVLHQGVGDTVRILPQIINTLRQRGLAATTISGLLAGK